MGAKKKIAGRPRSPALMTILCPICNAPLKRHKRRAGDYRVYVCECGKEFFFLRDSKNYSCKKFEDCALTLKPFKCKGCEINV
jgi:hypothetical protein